LFKPASLIARVQSVPSRELYFFALYRVLEAGILAGLLFSPLADLLGEVQNQTLVVVTSVVYLLFAAFMLVFGRRERWLVPAVLVGAAVDIVVAGIVTANLPSATAGIAMLLLFNVAAACSMLPLQLGLGVASLAAASALLEFITGLFTGRAVGRSLAEVTMFAITYLAVGALAAQIGIRARRNQELADRRGKEVENLFEINELIIRRMRTGVLVVDGENRIKLANEAANLLLTEDDSLAEGDGQGVHLPQVAPELARRLQAWRNGWEVNESPMTISAEQPEVQPRFARLLAGSELSIVFLDDATVVSRRAESLTLAALGRFSASLAHEIRNPLAAINYAVQLLEESDDINVSDKRLLEIIHQQCQRTNGIVESVLGLARRERASPEHVDLNAYVRRFVDDYRASMSIETDSLESVPAPKVVSALVDPRHLNQVLTVLVTNALNYGRMPEEPARVRLRVFQVDHRSMIDVMDRGPGIPQAVAAQLFRPFFTTSSHGTGLGLYIARELCRANQATLEYVSMPGGGSCFRIALPGPHTLLPA